MAKAKAAGQSPRGKAKAKHKAKPAEPAQAQPTKPEAPKMGRPSKFNAQLVAVILARIAEGESLRRICQDDAMPSAVTIYEWLADPAKADFANKYARACEDRAHALAEEALEIADNSEHDYERDGEGGLKFNADAVQRSRLRVDTRKWFAARLNPRKYGDRVATTIAGEEGAPAVKIEQVGLFPVKSAHADAKD